MDQPLPPQDNFPVASLPSGFPQSLPLAVSYAGIAEATLYRLFPPLARRGHPARDQIYSLLSITETKLCSKPFLSAHLGFLLVRYSCRSPP